MMRTVLLAASWKGRKVESHYSILSFSLPVCDCHTGQMLSGRGRKVEECGPCVLLYVFLIVFVRDSLACSLHQSHVLLVSPNLCALFLQDLEIGSHFCSFQLYHWNSQMCPFISLLL